MNSGPPAANEPHAEGLPITRKVVVAVVLCVVMAAAAVSYLGQRHDDAARQAGQTIDRAQLLAEDILELGRDGPATLQARAGETAEEVTLAAKDAALDGPALDRIEGIIGRARGLGTTEAKAKALAEIGRLIEGQVKARP